MGVSVKNNIRNLKAGNWYWISRAVLRAHSQALQPAGIAVYNALAYYSNSKTQACFPTHETLAKLAGVSRRTVLRKIQLMKKLKLISTERKEAGCRYLLLDPKDVTQKTQGCDRDDINPGTPCHINKNKITRVNNDKEIAFKKLSDFAFNGFHPKTKEDLLAMDLAEALEDRHSLPLYLSYCRYYPEVLLRKVLGKVKETPREKIKKTKGALFNYLIQKYADKTPHHPGN